MARLSVRQKKKITKKVTLTSDELRLIKSNDYSWKCKALKDIRDKIRDFYEKEQNKLCVFCKLPFRDDIHVEHLVPKDGNRGRKEFSYYSENLSCACKHCNTSKSTNNDMIPWDRNPYPKASIYFYIIHPHLDDYFDHIEIVDESRYVAKSVKGWHTIERCGLADPQFLEVLAEYMMYQNDSIIEGVLRVRKLQGDFHKIIDRFIDKIFR